MRASEKRSALTPLSNNVINKSIEKALVVKLVDHIATGKHFAISSLTNLFCLVILHSLYWTKRSDLRREGYGVQLQEIFCATSSIQSEGV